MSESVEFLVSLILCLAYIGVPVGLAGGICHFFGRRQGNDQVAVSGKRK